MIIGRLILLFVNALRGVFPGLRRAEPVAETGRKGGAVAVLPAPRTAAPVAVQGNAEPATKPGEVKNKAHDTDLSGMHGPIGYLKELYKRFTGDLCPAWAAALSFFSILSIPPILLCGLAILGFVIKSPQVAAAQTEQIIAKMLPGSGAQKSAKSIIQQLNVEQSAVAVRQRRGVTGLIGIALLFWSALQIFVNASTPLNAAFRVKEARNWIKLRLVALGLLLGCGALFIVSLLPAAGVQFLNRLHLPLVGSLPDDPTPFWISGLLWIMAVAVNTALFTLIYRYLPSPSARVNWRDARFGGAVAAILWEIAKQGFALYLQRMGGQAGYDKIYGSLGGLVLLVFWIYYSSMILLLGAEVAKLHNDMRLAHDPVPA